ncbi:hypothetical protein APY94_00230 [Thermococcus celericrescens]|uniref:PIN domain-containing protein n=1 Tax=Thermococcus celericrescens TaxID=227598 RepID=A0A117ITY7_9EURY|nr:hypothetical protein [Thermococcus celericrescens]KUH34836.1 hypothetical protein APY94_00230 [Thermococcus celericrescens]
MSRRESVVGDSSFYIAFLAENEINDGMFLANLLRKYNFIMGRVVYDEISRKNRAEIERIGLSELVEFADEYDYAALLSIIGDKVFEKGEYESVAIAYTKYVEGSLHSLIMDDRKARKWVEQNFSELKKFLRYSLRFLVNAYKVDKRLTKDEVLHVLSRVIDSIERGGRPFNLGKTGITLVEQLLEEVERSGEN